MGVGVASSVGGTDPGRHLQVIHLLAVQFNQAYGALTLPAQSRPEPRLTPREREILQWAARGKSAWAIGEILRISENSVEWHLKNVFRKLDCDSRITAVVKSLHLGLISI
ncbi:MAG: helix-turn-helix transcriptional regulator [Alphaproteobacteria bacterium]|nr:helix-turn-helix transcriptional regulator [Alphaproteobacteria bacterium]MBF0393097.1 helix-turn-helix transcriptional regulator [Alphaproteobacteria bacterium]